MINPEKIKQIATRKYPEFLQSIIANQDFLPLNLPIGKVPKDYIQLRNEVNKLINKSKEKLGYGYTIELQIKNTHNYGHQSLPNKITINTKEDYLQFINKQAEFTKFKTNLELIRSSFPELETWILTNPQKIIKHAEQWQYLLKVSRYFKQNYYPNLYIRELPIEIHTKFIEDNKQIISSLLEAVFPIEAIQPVDKQKKHIFEQKFSLKYEEPLIRFRILDRQLQEQYRLPFSDLSVPLSEFAQINFKNHYCFITENKLNFLTLPNLNNSFAIWGSGYKIQSLTSVAWLNSCSIVYWGDMDADGFKILHQLRSYFPRTISVMMDENTFKAFEKFAVDIERSEPEKLANLTEEEYKLYSYVSHEGKRLEQEHISHDFAVKYLMSILES